MDLLQKLKLRNLFGQGNQQTIQPVGQVVQPKIDPALFSPTVAANQPLIRQAPVITASPLNPPDTGLAALRNRATPDMDAYRSYLQTAPNRKDHQLSKLGKALAFTSGTLDGSLNGARSGMGIARGILDRPYENAMQDYSLRGGNLKELSELEYRGGTDDTKLEVAINANAAAQRKLDIDNIRANSTVDVNDARIAEIADRIKNSGKKTEINQADGQLYVIDLKTGEKTPYGKFVETKAETRAGEHDIFNKEEGTRQSGRVSLENLRSSNDKSIAQVKADLDNRNDAAKTGRQSAADRTSPTQRNAAFNGAYSQTITNNPNLVQALFKPDEKGNLVLKEGYDPEVYKKFLNKLGERQNAILGEKFEQPHAYPNESVFTTYPPGKINPQLTGDDRVPAVSLANDTPIVQDPVTQSLRASALAAIKETYPDDPGLLQNEEAIAMAMEQIKGVNTPDLRSSPNLPLVDPNGPAFPQVQGNQPAVVPTGNPYLRMPQLRPEFGNMPLDPRVRPRIDPRMQLRGIGGPTGG